MKAIFMVVVALMVASPAFGQRASLEIPSNGAQVSGIDVVSGWACEAHSVHVQFIQHHTGQTGASVTLPLIAIPYGGPRGDTSTRCGDTNNGFGMTFNWNLLGDGAHGAYLYINGKAVASASFLVTTLGEEFVRGAQPPRACITVRRFPRAWSKPFALMGMEEQQNFVISPAELCPNN